MNQLPLWEPPKPLPLKDRRPNGTRIVAAEDIHFSADKSVINAGTPGRVVTGGWPACNVQFDGYSYLVLCFWNMLAEVPS